VTDLETLRAALQEPPSEAFAEPDLAAIMATGTRIRRRRRLAAGGGVAAVAVAVVAVVFGATQLRATSSDVAGPPGPTLSTSATSGTDVPPPPDKPVGAIVDTGISDAKGELVIFGVAIDDPAIPQTHFGMVLAHRDATGKLTSTLAINEFSGSDHAAGFHQVTGGDSSRGGVFLPVLGYFVGPVSRITSTVHGKTVQASIAQWSEDTQVKFFWFTPKEVPDHNLMTPPVAYDAVGARLTK
jgi:hypothetical protein